MLTVKEHSSSSYAPRTYYNASQADLTVAFAVDMTTKGELLTKKAAGEKYIGITIEVDKLQEQEYVLSKARVLYRKCKELNVSSLNIAGNGIYTLVKEEIYQPDIDLFVFKVVSKVHEHWNISKIYTGGQTGVDLSGAKAGYKLGIETEVTLPKGYIQRFVDGKDYSLTKEIITDMITERK